MTGAGGFVGLHLCRALAAAGAEVAATVRPGGSAWRLDALGRTGAAVHAVELTDGAAVRRLVEEARPEVVFHAAARSAYDRSAPLAAAAADSVLTLAHLLDALAGRSLRRFVLLGSSLVYGAEGAPYREEAPLAPATRRGAVKAAASILALQHARETGFPLVEARLFSVYGPWEPLHRLIPRAIRAALLGEELPLTAPGLCRDPVFVEDAVEACLAGAYPAHASDRAHWSADLTRARELLGWRPRRSLREGLARTVPWMEEMLETGLAAGPGGRAAAGDAAG